MNLMIKGMEMPECCEVCPCYNWIEDICRITESPNDFSDARIEDCPLAKIPTPHGDLIDRDKLIQLFLPIMEFPEDERIMYVDSFIRALKNAPTIIEAEEEKNVVL